MSEATVPRQPRLSPHLRGHLLLFDPAPAPTFSAATGVRLLLIGSFVEIVRLSAVSWFTPTIPLLVLVAALLALGLVSVTRLAGVKLTQLGLRPWRSWTTTEKSYFVQVVALANVVFPLVLAASLRNRLPQSQGLWEVFVP